jgi:glutathione transport system ATP-binding protein
VITQAEILELFRALNRGRGMGIRYISHDLLSVAPLCHRVAILHAGEIVEAGSVEEIFRRPAHPYTGRLIAALDGITARHPLPRSDPRALRRRPTQ